MLFTDKKSVTLNDLELYFGRYFVNFTERGSLRANCVKL